MFGLVRTWLTGSDEERRLRKSLRWYAPPQIWLLLLEVLAFIVLLMLLFVILVVLYADSVVVVVLILVQACDTNEE